MKLIRFTLIIILVFIFFILIFEVVLCAQRGRPPLEPERHLFKSQFEEIYKRFFRKVRLSNGTIVYETQRKLAAGHSFPVHKIRGTKRIFVLGGSVAYSFSHQINRRYLEELLESSITGEKFEIIGCGMAAYDSYRVSLIHKEILNYEPDFIILLSGNNEYYSPVRVNLWVYRFNRLLRNLWIYRDLQDNLLTWGRGHSMFVGISRDKRLANYENNLRSMIHRAKKKKIPMVLCTLPANIRDCPPRSGFPIWEDKQFFLAWNALNKNEFKEARKRFEQFILTHPEEPFGYYFLAKSYDALRNYPQAQEYYFKSLDLDANPGDRCPTYRNEFIRHLCSQKDIMLVDLENFFIRMAPHGLPGNELFIDNCHWREELCPLIDEEIAQAIIGYYKFHLRSSLASTSLHKWRDSFASKRQDFLAEIRKHFENNKVRELLRRLGLIYERIILHKEVDFIDERTIAFLKESCQRFPELFDDRFSLKQSIFVEFSKSPFLPRKEILSEFDEIWLVILYHIGESLRRLGEYHKAIEYFNEVINLSAADACFSYLGRALIYYEIGEVDKAKRDFEEIIKKGCQHPLIKFYRESLRI